MLSSPAEYGFVSRIARNRRAHRDHRNVENYQFLRFVQYELILGDDAERKTASVNDAMTLIRSYVVQGRSHAAWVDRWRQREKAVPALQFTRDKLRDDF